MKEITGPTDSQVAALRGLLIAMREWDPSAVVTKTREWRVEEKTPDIYTRRFTLKVGAERPTLDRALGKSDELGVEILVTSGGWWYHPIYCLLRGEGGVVHEWRSEHPTRPLH